ncbi:MAG: c-type cytochrome [Rhodospirillales bacterium]|nr:c-type cytochrome [Rhodospirillales bacterium]
MRLRAAIAAVLLGLAAVMPARGGPTAVDAAALARIAQPPLGLPPVPLPADNPPSAVKIALGRKLFFDRRLSHNGTMSCAMCHVPEQGFTNNELATPIGVEGRGLRRNAPTILNVAYQKRLFHDGRETALETQVISPLLAPDEMANPSIGYVIDKIAGLPDYAGLFERAFGAGPAIGRLGQAIASWERSLLAADASFDRWYYGGEAAALSERQRQGYDLFIGKAGCAQCHLIGEDAALFTDGAFHNTGLGYHADEVAARTTAPVPVEIAPGRTVMVDRKAVESVGLPRRTDLGRHEVTLDPADLWRFKTPSLRNVALTAPYMHDGSLRSLEAVVRFYDRGAVPHEALDPMIRPLGLGEDEIAALVAFLESLTSVDVGALIADARSAPVGN